MHFPVTLLAFVICTIFITETVASANGAAHKLKILRARSAGKSRQARISQLAKNNATAAAMMVLDIPGINNTDAGIWEFKNRKGVDDFDHQVPWGKGVRYHKIPSVSGTFDSGFGKLPKKFGKFALNRTVVKSNKHGTAKIPVFMNRDFDPNKIRKAMVVFPSMWRDSWRFANVLGNVQELAKNQSKGSAEDGRVLIMAPMFLTKEDMEKGAGSDGDIFFKRQGWSVAGTSRGPKHFTGISSFTIVDQLVEDLLDRSKYPHLEDLIMIGHSMGGQANLRYAMFKKQSDKRMRFWIGNPGKYTYLTKERPMDKSSCDDYDKWPFGIGNHKSLPKYIKSAVKKGRKSLMSSFRNQRIHYFYGLNDNGGTSKECTHNVQGKNRLQRGAFWIVGLSKHSDGFPSSHEVSYVEGTAHDAYPMLASPPSLNYLYED